MDFYKKLEILASKRINTFYHTKHDFYKGSQTYFEEIHKEINEAEAENKINNKIYLEYELGDIFWDYMCLLQSLKAEWKIESVESILERTYHKFIQRVWEDGSWKGIIWDDIKKIQKQDMEDEHKEYCKKNNC